uniref:Uncharacterized protein n=1 Tax=Syphacia muris TaxID=451379 RepID=A0A0N5AXG5_9BILA
MILRPGYKEKIEFEFTGLNEEPLLNAKQITPSAPSEGCSKFLKLLYYELAPESSSSSVQLETFKNTLQKLSTGTTDFECHRIQSTLKHRAWNSQLQMLFENTRNKLASSIRMDFTIILLVLSIYVANAQLANKSRKNDETIIYSNDNPPRKCSIQGDRLNVDDKFVRRLSRPEMRELAQYKRATDRRRRTRSTRYDSDYEMPENDYNDMSPYDSYFNTYSDNSDTSLNQGYSAYSLFPYYYYPSHDYSSYTTPAPQSYSFYDDIPLESQSSMYKAKVPSFCNNLK